MRILGAIFAGGQSRRFRSDKAAALLVGRPLLDHVAAALRPQCAALVVVGRDWPGMARVDDRPRPGLGPLGALAGALVHAGDHGYDVVLTSGCDLPDLPGDLAARLAPGPAVIAGQHLLGLWPATLADRLLDWLEHGEDRSMRAWIAAAGATAVTLPRPLANLNTPEELATYERARCQATESG